MLLVIDAGNSSIKFGIFDGERLVAQWRIETDAGRTADDYADWLMPLLAQKNIKAMQVKGAIASCVVEKASPALRTLAENFFHTPLLMVGDAGIKTGITVKPAIAGADRVVNAAAAWRRFRQDCLIISMGTATTFDVVNGKGEFLGGAIAPGAHAMLKALRDTVSFPLPDIAIEPPALVIGVNTASAMQAGLYFGYAGLVERVAAELLKAYGSAMKVIATGGLSSVYAAACPQISHVEPDLILLGLQDIYALNKA